VQELYDVKVDRESLIRQDLGSKSTRCRVPLAGLVDDRWRQAYRLLQMDSTDLFRYRLELGTDTIAFQCQEDSTAELMLDRLEAFIGSVNVKASTLET
jgi:hypothetical protein